MTRPLWIVSSLLSLAISATAWALPRTMPYQGVLERDGVPQTGSYDLRFAIFRDVVTDASCLTAQVLGACGLWAEEQAAVAVNGGRFGVALGSSVPLAVDAFRGGEPFLAVAVRTAGTGPYTLLGGRQRLGASPFAFKSDIALPPIGAVIAWHKSMAGVGPLDPDGGWVECNGQTIVDASSPLNGQVVPDLNGGRRFLRGGATSGTLEADALQSHRHADAGHGHTMERPGWRDGDSVTPLVMLHNQPSAILLPGLNGAVSTGVANIGNPTNDPASSAVRTAGETRPLNMSVVWIMRIK